MSKRVLTPMLFVLLVFAGSLLVVAATGKGAREFAPAGPEHIPPAFIAENAKELYHAWSLKGGKGRVLLHFGRHLHFNSVDDPSVYKASSGYPVRVENPQREYEARLDYKNFLWVALQGNVARYVYNVLPSDIYQEKVRQLMEENYHFLERRDSYFMDGGSGLLRTITSAMPQVAEPVILNIDASYLGGRDVAAFADDLLKSGLHYDMVTFSLSLDSPDVTDAERKNLIALAERFNAVRLSTDGPVGTRNYHE